MNGLSTVLWIHYLPIATTSIAAVFSTSLYRRYRQRKTPHLLWWASGVAFYGLGTLIEAAITVAGNTILLNKAWYIAGAALGGYPLAQGSLYLSWPRRFANRATAISLPFVLLVCLLVGFSPVVVSNLQPGRPSGAILGWHWVRLMTPFINLYAAFFLIGGALVSAWRFWRDRAGANRAAGNLLIALGAILPGIGGSMAKAGVVEALYVGECAGLILIWIGERVCAWRPSLAREALAERQMMVGQSPTVDLIGEHALELSRFERSAMKTGTARVGKVAVLFMLLFTARATWAGDIVGTAADSSGGVLPSARVTLRNIATGTEVVRQADQRGRFGFEGLPVGIYEVTVTFEGFSQEARRVSLVRPDERVELSFGLRPGDLTVGVTVTATRAERDSLLIPVRTDTISRTEIESTSPLSTGSALIQAPGITPVASGPFEERPRLRGLDSTRLLVLVDGQRLNNARTATDRSGTEVGLIDLSTVDRLEVVGGSGSVLYGTDALAGTINIITNEPRFSNTLSLNYGFDGYFSSNETGRRGTALIGASSPRFAIQFAGTLEDYNDYRAGRGAEDTRPLFASGALKQQDTIDDPFGFNFRAFPDPFNAPFIRTNDTIPFSAGKGDNINTTALVSLSDTQSLQVKYIRRHMNDVGFADFQPPMFFQEVSLPFSNFDRISARYEARSIKPWFTNLRVSAYFQDQDRLLRNQFPVQFPVPSQAFFPINVFRLQILSDTEQHVRTPGLDVQGTLLLARKHVVTAGATFYEDRSRDQRTTTTQMSLVGNVALGPFGPQSNVFGTPVQLGPPTTDHPVRVPDATLGDVGLFLQDEWDITPFLHAVGGLRADRYLVVTDPTPGYAYDPLIAGAQPPIDPSTLPSLAGDRISRTALTGDIGVVIRASDQISLLARYGRSYRHPNLEELLFSGPATVGAIAPNVKVGPETGDNVDVGVKLRSNRYAASLSYFNNTYHGLISTEIVAETPAGPLSQAVNFDEVRIQGLEGSLEVPLSVGPGLLTLFTNLAFTRGTVLSGTNPLTGASLAGTPQDDITPFKAMPGVRFADSRDRFWVEYGARVESKVNRVAPTRLNSPFLIAQDLLALGGFAIQRVAWGFNIRQGGNRLGVTFAVENLTDRFYREQFQFAPARGRSFTMGIHVRGL
jgi:hemoglobin/transferrin/lactoferrin receptor protein